MYKSVLFAITIVSLFPLLAGAKTLSIQVQDQDKQPLESAVIWVEQSEEEFIASQPAKLQPFIMDQINKQFDPYVLAVPMNSDVMFPNSDSIKHHVYSFSAAKPFELKLYKGSNHQPLVFNKSGVVELGCNIHDWMLGYILVVQSHILATSDQNGLVTLEQTNNATELKVWHPRFENKQLPLTYTIDNSKTEQIITITQPLLPDLRQYRQTDKFDAYE